MRHYTLKRTWMRNCITKCMRIRNTLLHNKQVSTGYNNIQSRASCFLFNFTASGPCHSKNPYMQESVLFNMIKHRHLPHRARCSLSSTVVWLDFLNFEIQQISVQLGPIKKTNYKNLRSSLYNDDTQNHPNQATSAWIFNFFHDVLKN